MGVVVRRYIDFLILLIPTPLVSVLFLQQHPYFLFIKKMFFSTIVCSHSVGQGFESGSLRNGGMLILPIYFAVDGMPIDMYGESWIAGLLTSDDVMLYMAGFETTQRI